MTNRVRIASIASLVVGGFLTAEGLTWAADKPDVRARATRPDRSGPRRDESTSRRGGDHCEGQSAI
jgi:hypothetical protein